MQQLELLAVCHIVADLDDLEDAELLARIYPAALRPRPRRLLPKLRRLVRRAASSVTRVFP